MIIGHYWPHHFSFAGTENYIRRIMKAQVEQGNEAYLIQSDIKIFLNDTIKRLKIDVLHLHAQISLESPPEGLRIVRTVHNHGPYCLSGSKYLKRAKKPCGRAYNLFGCIWEHYKDHCGSYKPQIIVKSLRRIQIENNLLKSGMPIIVTSEFMKNELIRSGYSSQNLYLIRLPAPEDCLPAAFPEKSIPRFVFLGRMTDEKGVNWLLEAASKVSRPFKLDLAGDGPRLQALKAKAQKLGLNDIIHFHGKLEEQEAQNLIKSSWVVIFPSVWHEPAGLVPIEAAALGRAAISSRVGGVPEYASILKNSLLVEPHNLEELANAMGQIASNPGLAKKLGAEGLYNSQDHLSMDDHINALFRIYRA